MYMFMCVSCFLVVNTCQMIGWKDSSDNTFMWWGDYIHKAQVEEILCVYLLFFHLVSLCCYVFPLALHNIYFIHLWHVIAFCSEGVVKHQQSKAVILLTMLLNSYVQSAPGKSLKVHCVSPGTPYSLFFGPGKSWKAEMKCLCELWWMYVS